MQLHVLADTVEYHHLVVNGVTDNRKDGTDKRLVDFQREGHKAPQQGVKTDNERGIDGQGHSGTHREGHVAETYKDVNEDGEDGQQHADDGAVGDVFCHRRTNLGTADDGSALTNVGVFKGLHILLRY